MDFHMSELFDGRPPKGTRTPREESVYDLLDGLGVFYQRIDHDPADTIEKCILLEERVGVPACKNLFLTNRSGKKKFLLMMPGRKPFRTKFLSGQIDCGRCSFGDGTQMEALLGLTPGSVSLMGLKNDTNGIVRFLLDQDVTAHDCMRCHPCLNTSTLKLRTADVLNVILPAISHPPHFVALPWEDVTE